MKAKSAGSTAPVPTGETQPYLVTEVGTDVVRVDFFSAVKEPHFVAHVFTYDEAMTLAKAITTAALNCRPTPGKARSMARAQAELESSKRQT